MGLRIRLLKPNKWIKNMMSAEVKTAQLFTANGQPHPEGLLSPEIFGMTPEEKSVKTGWIRLPMPFIHPEIYSGFLRRRFRDIDNIINGSKKYIIDSAGNLIQDENGKTGLKWFYDNFDKINIRGSEAKDDDRILSKELKKSYNRLTKEDIFMDKVIVCELIVRDINTGGGTSVKVDELNSIYQDIIRFKDALSTDSNNLLINRDAIIFKIQSRLIALLDYAYDKIFGKDGIQRKKTMSKTVRFSSRNIISAPEFKGKFGSSPINLDNAGYPLSAVVGSFTPFFIYNLSIFLRQCYDRGMIHDIGVDEFEAYYDLKYCKALIEKYLRSWGERFDGIPASAETKANDYIQMAFNIDRGGTISAVVRKITLIEVFYMIAYNTIELGNKVTSITRYPILNKYNNVVTKIHVLSTHKTVKVTIDGMEYPYYPDIFDLETQLKTRDPNQYEEIIGSLFQETIKMSNTYLPGFNGDYDNIVAI